MIRNPASDHHAPCSRSKALAADDLDAADLFIDQAERQGAQIGDLRAQLNEKKWARAQAHITTAWQLVRTNTPDAATKEYDCAVALGVNDERLSAAIKQTPAAKQQRTKEERAAQKAARQAERVRLAEQRRPLFCTPNKVLFDGQDPLENAYEGVREREVAKLPTQLFVLDGANLKVKIGDNKPYPYKVTGVSPSRLVATSNERHGSTAYHSRIEIDLVTLEVHSSHWHVNPSGTRNLGGEDISGKKTSDFFLSCERR